MARLLPEDYKISSKGILVMANQWQLKLPSLIYLPFLLALQIAMCLRVNNSLIQR